MNFNFYRFSILVAACLALTQSVYPSSNVSSDCLTPTATAGKLLQSRLISLNDIPPTTSNSYNWQNVKISGMGFVTGLVIHSSEPDLIYARTDVGGLYRWNPSASSWVQLMDAEPDRSSIESIALDSTNPDIIYAATGAYTRDSNGEVLKSTDRGNTWAATNLRTPLGAPVRMGANENWRWAGERLAVDPNNSQIVYFGSRLDGLYRSMDGAKTWGQITTFPTKGTNGGIAFVVFDRRSGQGDRPATKSSQVLYAGVIGSGVYRSGDGGESWTLLTDGPDSSQNPQQAVIASNGTLYITFFTSPSDPQGSVWKYQSEKWSQITPENGKNYSAIAGDAHEPNTLLAATYPFSPDGLYRSTDGGNHWQTVKLKVEAVKWWPHWHLYTLMGGLAINPHRPKQVWLTTGFGVMQTEDITARPSNWCTRMDNLEELVVFVVKSPPVPNGAVFSGAADMHGFRHESLSTTPNQNYENGKFGDTTGIDFSETNPNIIVRVGSFPGEGGREDSQGLGAYSSDNGRSWEPFANLPSGAANGKVAVSAALQSNGKPVIVWAPQGDIYPHRSLDGGKTWAPVQGAPNRTTLQLWFHSQAIASDRVDGNLFYLYKYSEQPNQGVVYHSTDAGATWNIAATGLPSHWLHSVKAVPDMRGEVWLSVQGHSLYRSSNAGTSFTKLANVQQADGMTFGKPAPGRRNPTVFIYGTVNQTKGLFRSDEATSLPGDAANAKWVKVSTSRQVLGTATYLEGDRLTYGKVYVGTGGRGILYGQPNLD